jgi:shikimate kinase
LTLAGKRETLAKSFIRKLATSTNNLILCGFKSSGKTTLARTISIEKGLRFIDTDLLIDQHYVRENPALFRAQEKKVIAALQGVQNCVIATGGGVVLEPDNVKILKQLGSIIYLKVCKETLKQRLLQVPLPLILDPRDPEGSFEQMYLEREPLYSAIADQIVEYPTFLFKINLRQN